MTKSGPTDVAVRSLPIADGRGVGRVLSRIGDKWTVIIITLLAERPYRFGEMRRGISEISQQVLTTSLRALERDGFLSRTAPTPAARLSEPVARSPRYRAAFLRSDMGAPQEA